jgi:outer membrane receptor for ferrienterochelin and colicins
MPDHRSGVVTMRRAGLLACGLVALSAAMARAAETPAVEDLFRMPLDDLMKIEVTTAGRVAELVGDVPASVVVITRAEIEAFGYSTLDEILQHIPGVYAIDDYQAVGLGIRGYWGGVANEKLVFLVNGVSRVTDSYSSNPLSLISVPVEAIDRIEVVRGPMSVAYGNGAFFGVINLITAEPQAGSAGSLLAGSAGSGPDRRYFGRLVQRSEGLQWVVNAGRCFSGGIDQPLGDMVSDPAVLSAAGADERGRTRGLLEREETHFDLSARTGALSFQLQYADSRYGGSFLFPPVGAGNATLFSSTQMQAGYEQRPAKDWDLKTRFTFAQHDFTYRYTFVRPGSYSMEKVTNEAWQLEVDNYLRLDPRLDVRFGLSGRQAFEINHDIDAPALGAPNLVNYWDRLLPGQQTRVWSVFGEGTYRPTPALSMIAGLRLEKAFSYRVAVLYAAETPDAVYREGSYRYDEVSATPRLAAIYSPSDRWTYKLFYGRAISRPSYFHTTINIFYPYKRTLQPETIDAFELSSYAILDPRLSVGLNLFHNRLDRLISRLNAFDDEGNYESWFANAGRMTTNGLEASLQAKFGDRLRFDLSGTWQETRDGRPGFADIEVAYSPRLLGYLKAHWRATRRVQVALTGTYVGAMETYWDESLANPDGSNGGRIGDRTPGTVVLGANVRSEHLAGTPLYASLRVSNLLDATIRYPTHPDNPWADRGTLGAGREFLLSAGWRF